MTTFAELLLRRAHDDHPAVLFENEALSWREVVQASVVRATVARSLRDGRPFHIGVLLENVPEYLLWIGAAALAGATVVGINPTRRGAELAADIRHTDCQMIVTDSALAGLLEGLDTGVGHEHMLLVDTPFYRERMTQLARSALDLSIDPAVSDASTLLLLFTSGSTGAPKAVVCSQGRLAAIAENSSRLFGLTRDDVLYESMPMFHGNAIMANVAPGVALGATIALRRRFSASGFVADVGRYGATYFNYVGRALAYILATPESPADKDNRLRLGFGTEASARDIERFSRRFGCRIVENYGSSEGVITIHRDQSTPEAALGRPPDTPAMDVIIADPATGKECPPARFDEHGGILNAGEAIGEIVNRAGAPAFEGYYRNEAAVQARLRDGWYWSGDLGYRDADGWFYFAGRGTDWLRVDSENFAAAPIERIVARFPGAVMVGVYPVPDPRTGDQVMAALELDPAAAFDPSSFADFLAAQPDLGTKWAPRFVRVVAAMPLTGTGKIDKQPLRSAGWETDDPVYWQPGRGEPYRRLTGDDRAELRREFSAHGRINLLDRR